MMLFHRNRSVWFKMESRLWRSGFVVLGQVRAVRLEGGWRCRAPVKSSYALLLQLSRQAYCPIDRFVNWALLQPNSTQEALRLRRKVTYLPEVGGKGARPHHWCLQGPPFP